MLSHLRRTLSSYKPSALNPDRNICASVLIPIFENTGGPSILLTKRTFTVKYHKGEVSFPGGMYESEDGDTLTTAIRESGEEIGLKGSDIEIMGRLDDMSTFTGFVITPYVGLIPFPYDFKLNPDEVAYLIYLPLAYLLQTEPQIETVESPLSGPKESPAIYYEGERIWGATCRLLLKLRKIIEDGAATG
jgi:8-oxo-dGTP pyrophosphatase MutT (NUDIX family)